MPLSVDSSAYKAPAFSVPGQREVTGQDETGQPIYGDPVGGGTYIANAPRLTNNPDYFKWIDQLGKGDFSGFTPVRIPSASSGEDNKGDVISRLNEIGFVPQNFSSNPWGQTGYVPNSMAQYIVKPFDTNPKKDDDFFGTIMKVAPIALMAMGIPDFFSQFGSAAMGAEMGGIADAMNLGFGAGGIPAEASWLGAGMEGLPGTADLFGGGGAWDSMGSGLGTYGWEYTPGVMSGIGADTGAPVFDLSRPMTDWGSPDMGATLSNWLSNPMEVLKKLRGMSPLTQKAGPLQSGMNILQGLYGINQSRQLSDLARRASEKADPFGPYRAQYAQQLAALSRDPSLITKQPGYAAGLEAVRRSMAAQGYQGSGNMMAALSQYGQKFLGDEQNRLGMLAGAGFNPAAAGQIGIEGNISAAQLLGSSLNRLGGGIWQLLG